VKPGDMVRNVEGGTAQFLECGLGDKKDQYYFVRFFERGELGLVLEVREYGHTDPFLLIQSSRGDVGWVKSGAVREVVMLSRSSVNVGMVL